jgi:hypothetical protein
MIKIPKSQTDLIPGFEAEVAAHAFAIKSWRSHMQRVADDEKNGVTGIDKHWPLHRPIAHPQVAQAVNENDEAAYEIIDDGPTLAQILAAKKMELTTKVSAAEQDAIAQVAPLGKRRLFNLRESDIRNADAAVAAKIGAEQQKGIVASLTSIFQSKPFDMDAAVTEARASEDTQHLADQDDRRRRVGEIERIAAQAHHDIEDLTIETVDGWTSPVFPT